MLLLAAQINDARKAVFTMVRLLIADSSGPVREGIKNILSDEEDILVNGEAASLDETVERIGEQIFDIVVMDASLSHGGIMRIIGLVKEILPHVKVIVLNPYGEEIYCEKAKKAGAAFCLSKKDLPTQLIPAIRSLLDGVTKRKGGLLST